MAQRFATDNFASNRSKPAILMVTPYLPYPPVSGGRMRTYSLLQRLTQDYAITLVCYGRPEERAFDIAPLLALAETHVIDRVPSPGTLRAALLSLTAFKPVTMRLYDTPAMRATLQTLCSARRFDAIHIESFYMLANIPTPHPAPVLLAEPSIEYIVWGRHAQVAQSLIQRPALALEAAKMRLFEPRAWRQSAVVGAMSDTDADIMRGVDPTLNVRLTPNGVDENYFAPPDNLPDNPPRKPTDNTDNQPRRNPTSAIYMGDYKYFPNSDAMIYFVRDILPLIRAQQPDFTLTILGKDPPADLVTRRANPASGIIVTGMVEDTRPYLHAAGMFICPLRSGGGTRFKLLEALAAGCAVVSTRIGAEGLGAHDGEHMLFADTPADFAAAVVRLCNDRALAARLGAQGRAWVATRHSWRFAAAEVANIYESLIAKSALN